MRYLLVFLLTPLINCAQTIAFSHIPNELFTYTPAELQFSLENFSFTDPYDFTEISVDASLINGNDTLEIPCFWLEGQDTSLWACRFSPLHSGNHQIQISIAQNQTTTLSNKLNLSVSESNEKGFLQASENDFYWQFSNGEKFRGIGCNFAWENTAFGDEKFTYSYILPQYKEVGVNFIRTWMCPWNLPLEWKNPIPNNAYPSDSNTYNQAAIDNLDQLFLKCNEAGIYVQLVADYHGAISTIADAWGGNNYWDRHNYNEKNGGPCSTPQSFFTHPEARQLYKNRMRYMIARWGAYPEFAALEFWNEIDYVLEDGHENWSDTMLVHIADWHKEMANYVKSIDPYQRLLSTSIVWYEIADMFFAENLDYIQSHPYELMNQFPFLINYFSEKYKKPYVIGEFAGSWWGASPDELALVHGNWLGMFSPTPVLPLSWWWDSYHEVGYDDYYTPLSQFWESLKPSDSISLVGIGSVTSKALGLQADSSIYVYAYTEQEIISKDTLSIPVAPNTHYELIEWDPRTGAQSLIDTLYSTTDSVYYLIQNLSNTHPRILELSPLSGIMTFSNSTIPFQLQIVPNPNHGNFEVISSQTISEAVMTISDLMGRIVWQRSFFNTSSFYIHLGNKKQGYYLLSINVPNSFSISKKIILE